MKTLLVLLGIAASLYLLVCLAFFLGQRSFIYYPVPTRDAAVPVMPLQRGRITLQVSVREAAGPRAVVYFGGNAEDVSRSVDALQAHFGGAAVYALHYRGYGGSAGVPSEAALVGDGRALVGHVATRHPEIVLVGRSLGSGVAVQVARTHPPRHLVLVTPFDSMASLARRHASWLPVGLILRERYESVSHAPMIETPTTLIVAGRDEVVPPAHAKALLAAFRPGVATAVVLEGAGHNDIDLHPGHGAALRNVVRQLEADAETPSPSQPAPPGRR